MRVYAQAMRSNTVKRFAKPATVVVAIVLSASLSGCAQMFLGLNDSPDFAEPTESFVQLQEPPRFEDMQPNVAEAEAPEADAEIGDIVFPECDSLVSVEELKNAFPDYEPNAQVSHDRDLLAHEVAGQDAKVAAQDATQAQFCGWDMPLSQGIIFIWLAELPQQTRVDLESGLREASYQEHKVGDLHAFSLSVSGDPSSKGSHWWYGFYGNMMMYTISDHEMPTLFDSVIDEIE